MTFQDSYPGEVPATIRPTIPPVKLRRLFVALLATFLFIPAEFWAILARSDLLLSIFSTLFIILFFALVFRIYSLQTKNVLNARMFGPRPEQVWVKLDGDDLVIRLPGKREAYRPSRLDRVDNTSFNLWEGEMNFQLVFQSTSDASKMAETIKNKFLNLQNQSR